MTTIATKESPAAVMKQTAEKQKTAATPAQPAAPAKKSFKKPAPKHQKVKQVAAVPGKGKTAPKPVVVSKGTKREDYLGSLVDAAMERKQPQEVHVHVEVVAVPPAAMGRDHVVRIPAPASQPAPAQESMGNERRRATDYNPVETRTAGYTRPQSNTENKSKPETKFHGRQSINPVIKIK